MEFLKFLAFCTMGALALHLGVLTLKHFTEPNRCYEINGVNICEKEDRLPFHKISP
jgi:hypothetical protein